MPGEWGRRYLLTMISPLPAAAPLLDLRQVRWHRPLLALAVAMAALTVFCAVALLVDPRQVTGLDVWAKPLKFALSTGVYAVSLSVLIGLLTRFRRTASVAGTIVTVGLAIELLLIVWAAAAGTTSHFNVSSALSTTVFAVMGGTIAVVWLMALLVAVLLFRNRLGDPARALAIRAGAVIGAIGMALAFLMTSPTAAQLADFGGIAGAHTVGLADGGPGLPILGWSTVAGDLRIPHFVGMHALQLLPIAAILLEVLARRIPLLSDPALRLRLVAVLTVTYAATVAVVTWQALSGQSIVSPAGAVLLAGSAIGLACGVSIAALLGTALLSRRRAAAARPPVENRVPTAV
ncbi:MAG: putative rane protein [Naasia sp.]|jgi:hypothetical protein|nr:putative rane protein [Naasia sp.]